MKRRLIKQGGGGYTIYLPKKWVDEHNLSQGENIDLEIVDDDLVIKSQKKDQKKEIRINLGNDTESSIRTIITNAYRLGYDRVIVDFDKESQFKIASSVIKSRLLGFDIISREKNFFIIENITEPSIEQVDNIFLKVLFNITELIENLEKLFNKEKTLEYIEEIEERIQQYDNFVRRANSKENKLEKSLSWNFHSDLIHAQRELYLAALFFSKNEVSLSKEVKAYLSELKLIYNLLREGYFSKNIKNLEKIHYLEKKSIYQSGYKLISSKKGNEQIILYRIMSSIRLFYLSSSPLSGLILLRKR